MAPGKYINMRLMLLQLFGVLKGFHKLCGEVAGPEIRVLQQLQVERYGSFYTLYHKLAQSALHGA